MNDAYEAVNDAYEIDVTFDFRTDSDGHDPDSASRTLKRYHQLLWSKALPDGIVFHLSPGTRNVYLHHRSEAGDFVVGSDTIATSHRKALGDLYAQLSEAENEDFHRRAYTVGGTLIFPLRNDGGQSINQRRGMHPLIRDRFDLTLECIRRHYAAEPSPLNETLSRYSDFFDLFRDFRGYIDFFYLQDLVDDEARTIRFFSPFNSFQRNPLPRDLESYVAYREATLRFVEARNLRIRAAHGSASL